MIQIGGTPKRGVAGEDLPADVLIYLREDGLLGVWRYGMETPAVGYVDHPVKQGEKTAVRDDYFAHLRAEKMADTQARARAVPEMDEAEARQQAENALLGLDFIHNEIQIKRTRNPIRRWWLKRKRAHILERMKIPQLQGQIAVNATRIRAGSAVYFGEDGKVYPTQGGDDGLEA